MFNLDIWRSEVQRRCWRLIRNPRAEVALFGTDSVLCVLASRVLEPFFEQWSFQPLEATLALSRLTQSPGTSFLMHNAASLRYQQHLLWSRLHTSSEVRRTFEHIVLGLDILPYLIQEMGDVYGEWFRIHLRDEIDAFQYKQELGTLRALLSDPPWQTRYAAIQALQKRHGHYSNEDFEQLTQGLSDRSAYVRAAVARQIGVARTTLPQHLLKLLFDVALFDRDVGVRYAAARAIGIRKDQLNLDLTQERLLTALFHEDRFTRSAACLVLAQLGAFIAAPHIIDGLLAVLTDPDPYAREAAATALGAFGEQAVQPQVFEALSKSLLDTDQYVHEAALEALRILRPPAKAPPLEIKQP